MVAVRGEVVSRLAETDAHTPRLSGQSLTGTCATDASARIGPRRVPW